MMDIATTHNTVAHWREPRHLAYDPSMRPRVLVIDDDLDYCKIMAQLLMGEGFDIDIASNGQDGLDKAHANPPRLIVLDMTMPVMDGWAFRAHQRYCGALAAIPVVIISGVPPERLRKLGMAAALQKPFHMDEFIGAIRAHLPA